MLFVEKMIKELRAKGYDDFYMANLASKYDWICFFFIWLLQVSIVMGIYYLASRLIGISESRGIDLFGMIGMSVACSATFLFFISWAPEGSIRTKKDEGESDLRITYLICSWVSRLMLKVFRYAPIIAMAILPIVFIGCIRTEGFRWQMLLSSAVGIVLLIVCSPFYHKAMRRISKEGSYYVDWKTNQDVEHFEETYSRHEKWWLSEAEMDFEKFNVDRYRSIRLSAFIGTFACLLGGAIFALSWTPLFGMDLNPGHSRTSKVENVVTPKTDETQQATELSATTDNEMEAEADVVEDEDPIGDADVVSEKPAEEVAETTQSAESVDDNNPQTMYIGEIVDSDGYANVREKPSIDAKIVRTLPDSRSVHYYKVPGSDWYKVYSIDDEYYGYVHKSRVKFLYKDY